MADNDDREPPTGPPFQTSQEDPSSQDEAEEDLGPMFEDDVGDGEDDEDGEDLLGDNWEEDYRAMPALDRYEEDGLHDEDVEEDPEDAFHARRAAEDFMDARDEALNPPVGGRLPRALDADDDDDGAAPRRKRPRQQAPEEPSSGPDGGQDPMEEDAEEEEPEFYEDLKMYDIKDNKLSEVVAQDFIRRFIAYKFRKFLREHKDKDGRIVYHDRISRMHQENHQSLIIDMADLMSYDDKLCVWVCDVPAQVLEVFEEVLKGEITRLYPNHEKIHKRHFVRLQHVPLTDKIRDIRQSHLDTMVRLVGVVTRRTGVFPQLQQAKYDCAKCGAILGPFFQNGSTDIKIGSCPECQSKGPFTVNIEQTIYRNYQKLSLQESPGSVPAGRLPRYKEVILLDDLIDRARPGEEIEVAGIYTNSYDTALNLKNGFPVFSTVVEANYVEKLHDYSSSYKLTDEDKKLILELSKDPRIGQRIIRSIAPSIYGHLNIKRALALAMFGGQEKNVNGKHRLRGDINVLLLGDPGTAKSQFLKYVEKTAERAVYTTGKGASAVGLTASVHKDPITREWTLEGGALVLADRGMCLIDEFDKMNDQDRVSIHEAMEQQSISISKAGIITSLQARCSVIAAANPVGGRYDSSKTFGQNVELTEPILSRFDVLAVVKDLVDEEKDRRLAEFVVDSHARSHPRSRPVEALGSETENDTDIYDWDKPFPQTFLKKYITYAKQHVHPKLQNTDLDKLSLVYADLRRESMHGQGVPIAVRHIESMIRMSEAHARMHLRQYVTSDDVDLAISTMLESFISTQKFGIQRALHKSFRKFMTRTEDLNELLLHGLHRLMRDAVKLEELRNRRNISDVDVTLDDFEAKAREYGVSDLQPFFDTVLISSDIYVLNKDQRVIHCRVPA